MRTLNVVLILASIAVAPFVCAAEGGDAQRGHAYAKKVCAKCHAVEGGDMISPTTPLRTTMNARRLGCGIIPTDQCRF